MVFDCISSYFITLLFTLLPTISIGFFSILIETAVRVGKGILVVQICPRGARLG